MPIILCQHSEEVAHIINSHSYKRVVLQISKSHLKQSFQFTKILKKLCQQNQTQFYTLYDSLKKPCCTDIIGARHIDYDALFHFGHACFSEQYQPNHFYILPQFAWPNFNEHIQLLKQEIMNNNINLVICDQSIYGHVMKIRQEIEKIGNVEIARLPFDRKQEDQYFGFSYYYSCRPQQAKFNVLVIKPNLQNEQVQDNNTSLLENLCLCKNNLNISSIFTFTLCNGFAPLQINVNKRIMQRLSQIGQLQKYTTFGILVSNPSTNFCQRSIQRCRNILESRGLKHFTFMMNNLNECKLGNFPQIQVYIVISCYNYSLYSIKDFYRLVVTPEDIQIAFGEQNYQNYNFDLGYKSPQKQSEKKQGQEQQKIQQKQIQKSQQIFSLVKINNQLAIQDMIQTLDYYRNKEYKGLDFSQKKEIQKIKKGKIGIAEQYRPIE